MSEFATILELLGDVATLALIEAYGGTRLAVPREIAPDHPLRAQLGMIGVTTLLEFFAGTEIKVPMARPWRAKIYRSRGMTYREMARRLGCTEAAVYSYIAAEKAKAKQGTLAL